VANDMDKNVIRPRLYHLATIGHKEEFEKLQERIEELEEENKQLKGEEPIPFAWWKDCPKLAQKTMERIIETNDHQAERIKELELTWRLR